MWPLEMDRLSSSADDGAFLFFICVGNRERGEASVTDMDRDSFQFLEPSPISSCLLCAALIASGQEADLIVPV